MNTKDFNMNASLTYPLRILSATALAWLLSSCLQDATRPDPDSPNKPTEEASLFLAPLVIEEIMPGNVDLLDERGEDPGWVELSNISDTTISLGNWTLKGEKNDGPALRLPDTTLLSGERILIFFSGLDRRDLLPAGDTLNGFSLKGYAWSDSQNNPPGRSSYEAWEIPGSMRGTLQPDNIPAISASLILRDPNGTDLDWSSVEFSMTMPEGVLDAGGRNRLLMRATLPEGQSLLLQFCEEGQQCWQGANIRVEGTGRRLDTYDLSLLGVRTDFSRLSPFRRSLQIAEGHAENRRPICTHLATV
jgi:hypothetical protein